MFVPIALTLCAFAGVEPVDVDGSLFHPNRLLVQISHPVVREAILWNGYPVLRNFNEIGYVVVEVPTGTLDESRRAIKRIAGVVRVDLDRAARVAYTPNDPLWPNQWHFLNIQVDDAWDVSLGGASAIVAVIDTGVEVTHEDLQANIWVNADEIPQNGVDDDQNGYVDDINGYDFAYNDPDPNDVYGHGTPCAGLAAGVGDNSIGVSGVAPRARIMALKASIDEGYFYDSNNVAAYLYAANNGAKVLSMSFFSDRVSNSERLAIDYCANHGVLPVAASGNSNHIYPYYPAAYESTLAVAATNQNDNKAGFSDFGTWVDVAAPGVSLTSVAVNNGYTGGFGGTSGATPHVAGVAALLFGAKPNATVQEVRNAIEDTAVLLTQAPFGEFTNYGLVDTQAALNALLGAPAPAVSPRVRYLTPASHEADGTPGTLRRSRIYGRGLQKPALVQAMLNGKPVKVVGRARDWADLALPKATGTLNVYVNGALQSSIALQTQSSTLYTGIEGSTQGATLTGGFFELLKQDTAIVTCSRRNDGNILVQSVFRRVKAAASMSLVIRRRYTGTTTGQERLSIYDWSTASYPYGSYDVLSDVPLSSAWTTTTIPLTNATRYPDDEGTVYFQLLTSDVDAGGKVEIDFLHLVK